MDPHPAGHRSTSIGPDSTYSTAGRWRGAFKRNIAWALIAKLIALFILWALFFSPAHRTPVDDSLAERRFSLAPEAVHD